MRVSELVVAGGGCCCGGLPGTGVVAIIATESHVDSDVLLVSGVVGEDGGAACAAHSTGLFSMVVVVGDSSGWGSGLVSKYFCIVAKVSAKYFRAHAPLCLLVRAFAFFFLRLLLGWAHLIGFLHTSLALEGVEAPVGVVGDVVAAAAVALVAVVLVDVVIARGTLA